jgi:group I intron endonuclease
MGERNGKNNPMYGKPGTFKGKHHSDESKKKLSESRMGKYKGLDNPKTKIFTVDNDELNIHLENILVEEVLNITNMKKSTLYQSARTRIPFNNWKIGYIEDKDKPFNQREKKISWREKLKLGMVSEDTTPIEGRIYIHKNKINGKCYVGQTIRNDLHERWKKGKGYKVNQVFSRAINKYGWDNFEHIVLEEVYKTQKELNEAEIKYIELYDSVKNGYNILPGGFYNPMSNPESKEKMKKAITGLKRTPEQIERNRQAKLNMDPEKKEKLRKNLSEIGKTWVGEKNPFYGKTHSEETRKKLSMVDKTSITGENNYKSKKVICNKTKEIFISIRDASEKTGIPASSISNDCRNLYNKRKKERITFSYYKED